VALEAVVASGDLPAGVVVLEEGPCPATDEGRGMMEIIHDIAPGASQAFHTALEGQASLAQGIIDLANVLREAQLQRAELSGAELQGADLSGAELQGASLVMTQLQGANLSLAELQRAELSGAELQGANLSAAELQGANLGNTQLQGADLRGAHLQVAHLFADQLQGANLSGAQLQGADLSGVDLQGADLRFAELYGATFEHNRTALVDLRAARWTPLNAERLGAIREVLDKTIPDPEVRDAALERIERTGNAGVPPPILESCLIDPDVTPELNCEQKWLPAEAETFRGELFPVLEKLTCEWSAIARDFIRQELAPLRFSSTSKAVRPQTHHRAC
jgi:uncharacterized protein YjbI with pentapeptide repeats